MFDRDAYFDSVRASLFGGKLSQDQVDGQNAILDVWEMLPGRFPDLKLDLRWLAYMFATTYHETSKEMQPIEEYSKGEGMEYGVPDPETGQTYYGRGYVQLTWRDNYCKADAEIGLSGDDSCEWHAENALDKIIAAKVMFIGMYEGWFRSDSKGRQTLPRYFNDTVDDAYTAREIINGDKTKVPSWSNGVSIGNLIKGYHQKFFSAIFAAWTDDEPQPAPEPEQTVIDIDIQMPPGITMNITVNGSEYTLTT